jgi:hypothetical protein
MSERALIREVPTVNAARSLRHHFAEAPGSIGEKLRLKRWEVLRGRFPDLGSMSVIDLGGRAATWERSPVRPKSVLVVNLEEATAGLPAWLRAETADACNLPRHITSGSYDLVFSNSVLEHVGGHAQRLRFANAVHSLAPRYWVQTPNRYFPVEPHWLFPGLQFLPVTARAGIVRRWPLGHTPLVTRADSVRAVMDVELIGGTEMRAYFSGSDLIRERIGGFVKSLIAVRSGDWGTGGGG